MQLDLDDAETRALLNVLVEVIEADKYPLFAADPAAARHSDEVRRDRRAAARARAQAAPCGDAPAAAATPEVKVYEPPSRGRYKRR